MIRAERGYAMPVRKRRSSGSGIGGNATTLRQTIAAGAAMMMLERISRGGATAPWGSTSAETGSSSTERTAGRTGQEEDPGGEREHHRHDLEGVPYPARLFPVEEEGGHPAPIESSASGRVRSPARHSAAAGSAAGAVGRKQSASMKQ